jgi:Methyltransferase domain
LHVVDQRLLEAARAAVGFMPDDEGLALFAAGLDAAAKGPLLEIGTYCGKSAIYLGAAARDGGSVLYTVDHHRGSEENQAGWEHHDERLVDARTGRMDTLPFFRRTMEDAGLEDVVIAVIGHSPTVAAHWATPLGLVFVDGGHAFDVALPSRRPAHSESSAADPRTGVATPEVFGFRDACSQWGQARRASPTLRERSSAISTPAARSSAALRPSGRRSPRKRPAVGPVPVSAFAASTTAAEFHVGCSTG